MSQSPPIETRPTSGTMQWACPNCATQHIVGDVCPVCGALHDSSTKDGAPAPFNASSDSAPMMGTSRASFVKPPGMFLFDYGNRAFVEGTSQKIANSQIWLFMIGIVLFVAVVFGIFLYPEWSTQRALAAQGHETQGTIPIPLQRISGGSRYN